MWRLSGAVRAGTLPRFARASLDLKTIVVEKDPFLGGTCLHVGCIPTKVLLHHADVYEHFKNGEELGFDVSGLKINWPNIIARKEKIVKKHAKGIEFLFKKNKVEWVQGWGRYEGPGKVSVEKDGKKTMIEASNVLLISGSEARSLPGIEPDHKQILTNRSILELPSIPKSLIIVGAGAVGVEFASIYNSFGTRSDDSGGAAARRARRGRRDFGGAREDLQEAEHSDFHAEHGAVGKERRERRHGYV